jgi:hypothetical protein
MRGRLIDCFGIFIHSLAIYESADFNNVHGTRKIFIHVVNNNWAAKTKMNSRKLKYFVNVDTATTMKKAEEIKFDGFGEWKSEITAHQSKSLRF